jgi:small subunit ribosomal protein S4
LAKYGLVSENATADDVLRLTVRDILERRLQTVVYRLGLAKTIYHARQLIVHRHIAIGDQIVNVPGYLVKKEEEGKIRLLLRPKTESAPAQ